jgi:hypothetical protein
VHEPEDQQGDPQASRTAVFGRTTAAHG